MKVLAALNLYGEVEINDADLARIGGGPSVGPATVNHSCEYTTPNSTCAVINDSCVPWNSGPPYNGTCVDPNGICAWPERGADSMCVPINGRCDF